MDMSYVVELMGNVGGGGSGQREMGENKWDHCKTRINKIYFKNKIIGRNCNGGAPRNEGGFELCMHLSP